MLCGRAVFGLAAHVPGAQFGAVAAFRLGAVALGWSGLLQRFAQLMVASDVPDNFAWRVFWLLQVTVAARVRAAVAAGLGLYGGAQAWIALAALAWAAVCVAWTVPTCAGGAARVPMGGPADRLCGHDTNRGSSGGRCGL